MTRHAAATLLAAALAVHALIAAGCKAERVERATRTFTAMGGVPIHVTGWDVEEERFAALVEAYRKEVERLESAMSVFREDSAIAKANRAGGVPVPVDGHTAAVVAAGLRWAEATGGAFDPTVGALVALWKDAERAGAPPTAAAIDRTLQRIGARRVQLGQKDGRWVLRLEPGTMLDLGGIAQGYFADVGVRWLRANGVPRAVVEVSGDVATYDDRPRPQPFRLGVRHPFDEDGLLGTLTVDGGGVVTSGDYERGLTIAGRRYNHIIDPRSGRPAEGVHSVTILAPDATTADALATGVLVLGAEAGLALVDRIPGVEALLVVADDEAPDGWRVVTSEGVGERFQRGEGSPRQNP